MFSFVLALGSTGNSRFSVSLAVVGAGTPVGGTAFTFRLHRDVCAYGGGQPWQDPTVYSNFDIHYFQTISNAVQALCNTRAL